MSKGWTEERRKKQAEMIREWKPWEKSTGPRTKKGKEKTRMNALRHGWYSLPGREFDKALRTNRDFIRHMASFALLYGQMNGLLDKAPDPGE